MDLSERTKVGSGGPYEDPIGYSRVLATGPFVYVAGTTAGSDGSPIPAGVEAQTAQTMEIIKSKLLKVGCTMDEVVRVRMYVVDIKQDWEAVSEVMNRYFKDVKPVMTMVEVKGLIDDDMRIEIEVDAVRKAFSAAS
ncbi:endoribonuclease L-PSP [Linderina pennispora]|uniref:Endoribonuclease L-PSP n=1 Tax=Linderina pennispora TaxID=61395 RepID=A0A1Y1WJS2_9FUNG|nr:endoribonuclease L-PSP [Linderina pennispora]ORX73354.1 endoribonuclease L-PSP [Linderina pennispora]